MGVTDEVLFEGVQGWWMSGLEMFDARARGFANTLFLDSVDGEASMSAYYLLLLPTTTVTATTSHILHMQTHIPNS